MKYRKLVLSRINTIAVLRHILMYSILQIKGGGGGGGGGGVGGGERWKSAKEYTERSGLNFMRHEKTKVFH